MSGRPVWFGGIADTMGLESCVFLFDRDQAIADELAGEKLAKETVDGCQMLNTLELRARFNPHRHAVVYTAVLSRESATEVCMMIREDPILAYYELIRKADEIRVHRAKPEDFLRLPEVAKALRMAWGEKHADL